MPLINGLDDWRDTAWFLIGGEAAESVFQILSPTMRFATGSSPTQVGVPVVMTPELKFSNGGVIGIPFYLPGGKTAGNNLYINNAIAGTKVNNAIVGIVKDTRPTAGPDVYLVLVSQDNSWLSWTKIQNMLFRFSQAVSTGAIKVGDAINEAAKTGWEGLPAWLRWIFEHPGTSAAIVLGVMLAPTLLSSAARIKGSYKALKQA